MLQHFIWLWHTFENETEKLAKISIGLHNMFWPCWAYGIVH